jgi:hypothetical protein
MHEFSAKDIDGHMVCLDKYRWVSSHMGGVHGWSENGDFLTGFIPTLSLSQGFRVHRHQRGLAMRQN